MNSSMKTEEALTAGSELSIGHVMTADDATIAETVSLLKTAVVKTLMIQGLTLFTAESCTGGMAAKEITDVPGASAVLKGGVVSYTNEIKTGLLGVSPETIARYTAVSEACAAEMAEGARRLSGADLGIASTGYADGGEGVPEGMAGVVFVALSHKNGTKVERLTLTGDRHHVRQLAVKHLFTMILNHCRSQGGNA